MEEETPARPVSSYETGKSEADKITARKLADALGLPVAYFHASSDLLAEVISVFAGLALPDRKQRWRD